MIQILKNKKFFTVGLKRQFSTKRDYDVIVIGGGPGGYVCSIRCGQHKLKVLNVNIDKMLGGTCLNRGCIPSKSLLHMSHAYYESKNRFKEYGLNVDNVNIDINKMHKHKLKCMNNLGAGISYLFKKNKVDHIIGNGSLLNEHTVLVKTEKEEKTITSERIVLATGSVPIEIKLKEIYEKDLNDLNNVENLLSYDHEIIQTSDDILNFKKIPKKMTIIGAGVIGLEIGSVFSRLGTDVTIIEYSDRLCKFLDPDVSKTLLQILQKQKLKFEFNSTVLGGHIKNTEGIIFYKNHIKNKIEKIKSDLILVCVGRKSNLKDLNLNNLNIELTSNNKIKVDEHFNVLPYQSIKAIGDIIDGPMLAHKAEEEGYILGNILLKEIKENKQKKNHLNYDLIPSVIYTHPEVASVGMNEESCKKNNINYKTSTFPFSANSRSRTIDDFDGIIKLIVQKDTNKILGSQIIGNNASDLINTISIYVSNGGTTKNLSKIIFPHPTFSEVIKEVSLESFDKAIHM